MCISACPLARAHAHVCEWGLQGAGGTGRGGVGDVSLCVCVCVCVCVCGGGGGVYMVAILKVSRLGVCVCVHGRYLGRSHGWRRERERVKFVSIVMWPVTKGLPVRDQC